MPRKVGTLTSKLETDQRPSSRDRRSLDRCASRSALRCFARDERGVTAVEMAFVAGPFLFGLLAIFEVALTFLGGQTLQMAVDSVSRQIRTGEVDGTPLATRNGFVAAVCREAFLLYDCEKELQVDIQEFPTFRAIAEAPPEPPVNEKGEFDENLPFTVGKGSSIIVARAFYKRDPIAPVFTHSPALLGDKTVLISAALVFQNEPF